MIKIFFFFCKRVWVNNVLELAHTYVCGLIIFLVRGDYVGVVRMDLDIYCNYSLFTISIYRFGYQFCGIYIYIINSPKQLRFGF